MKKRKKERSAELLGLASALRVSGGAATDRVSGALSGGDICAASRTPAADRSLRHFAACLSALLVALAVGAAFDAPVRAPRPSRRPARVDLAKLDAISRAQRWTPAGDELAVLERVEGVTRHPGAGAAWSAERLNGTRFLVLFHDASGAALAFEVDRRSGEVWPSPETLDGLALRRYDEHQRLLTAQAGLSR
jgi:hypothetical protein